MYAIGIDLGATKIEGGIISSRGVLTHKKRVSTCAEKGRDAVLKNIVNLIKDIKKDSKKEVVGIGISVPGFIDASGKFLFSGGTLSSILNGVNLRKEIEKNFVEPIVIGNDANCFVLAEAVFGAAKDRNVVVGVIWGTGIGAGNVVNKKAYSGSFEGFGEFGHIVLDPKKKGKLKCNCGQAACLEMLASGAAIKRLYKKRGGKIKNAGVKEIYHSDENVAKDLIEEAIQYLGLGLSILVNTLNPQVIVIGGGVSKLPDEVYTRLKKVVKKYSIPIHSKNLKIVRHSISDSAGTIGAGVLVLDKFKRKLAIENLLEDLR